MDEELDLGMNTGGIDVELAFLSSSSKPKTILTIDEDNPNAIVSLLLNADKNATITSTHPSFNTYESVRATFEKYDIIPRLCFYTGNANEILPWLEGKFDLILTRTPVDEELLESLLADGGHVAIKNDIVCECDMCCFKQVSIQNVTNYSVFVPIVD